LKKGKQKNVGQKNKEQAWKFFIFLSHIFLFGLMRFVRYIELANIGTRGGTVPGAVATGRLAERAFRWAPGRYRSRYRTNVAWFDLDQFTIARMGRLAGSVPRAVASVA